VPFVPQHDPRPDDAPWGDARWPVAPETLLGHGSVAPSIVLSIAQQSDAEELFEVLDDDRVWAHVRGRPASAAEMAASLSAAPSLGRFPWIVRRDGCVVGTTSFLEVAPIDARLEIGFTLYAPDVWGTDVNPACKLLLMSWAFDHGYGRVQLKTDIRNVRSQQAIARLGASYEGVLRRYQRRQDGSVRDTVLFSVTAEEWPMVKSGLIARLQP
jgi:RimJ/RimL family protein N-acetyltransferase